MELIWHVTEHAQTTGALGAIIRVNRLLYHAFRRNLYRFDIERRGSSALLWASAHGHVLVAEMSLNERAHVLPRDNALQGALMLAVYHEDCTMLKLLARYGAQVDVPFEFASAEGPGYSALVNDPAGWFGNALHLACRRGNAGVVELLIAMGADIHKEDEVHGNALLIAAWAGNEEIINLLIRSGAEINVRSGHLDTALQGAAWAGNLTAAKILIEHGANVHAQGGIYGTALQAASWTGSSAVIKLLLRSDADVNALGGRYGSARQAACMGGHKRTEGLLQYWHWRQRLIQMFDRL